MRTKSTPHPAAQRDLNELRALTWMMREHQEQINRLGRRRRELVLKLREKTPERPAVTYTNLAEAMDVSDQAVHKIISGSSGLGGGLAEDAEAQKEPAKKAARKKA